MVLVVVLVLVVLVLVGVFVVLLVLVGVLVVLLVLVVLTLLAMQCIADLINEIIIRGVLGRLLLLVRLGKRERVHLFSSLSNDWAVGTLGADVGLGLGFVVGCTPGRGRQGIR